MNTKNFCLAFLPSRREGKEGRKRRKVGVGVGGGNY
jgi:hypothetical protein